MRAFSRAASSQPSIPDTPPVGSSPAAKLFYYNPYSGEMSLDTPKADAKTAGGILADSMGMGKTL